MSGRSAASQTALPQEANGAFQKDNAQWRSLLTPRQYAILRDRGTDPRHTGEYDQHFKPGVYVCAACSAPLYTSEQKFDCGCAWPGFWTNVSKAVQERPESDGTDRVEIVCNYCYGHLGHIFRNEGFSNPAPNERHCVNSTSLKFVEKPLSELQKELAKRLPEQ